MSPRGSVQRPQRPTPNRRTVVSQPLQPVPVESFLRFLRVQVPEAAQVLLSVVEPVHVGPSSKAARSLPAHRSIRSAA
jgi:hypothetical protein